MKHTEYFCVFRADEKCTWVSSMRSSTELYARAYGAEFESKVVAVIAKNPGICPPVGIRADQCSHRWVSRLVGPYGSINFEDQLEPRR